MQYLLDTHTLIWLIDGNSQLGINAITALKNPNATKFVSVISLWEIAIKTSTGKLHSNNDIRTLPLLIKEAGFSILPVKENHALAVATLTFHHKDPFDRLLIAQAQIENLILLTKDSNISLYDVSTLW